MLSKSVQQALQQTQVFSRLAMKSKRNSRRCRCSRKITEPS